MSFDGLETELSRAEDNGIEIRFWWRDDDAIYPSASLDRLLALSARFRLRPLLAVIPAKASGALADRLAGEAVDVAQHGYAHENWAPRENKKSEFPESLSAAQARHFLCDGKRRMDALFGGNWPPIFVPPWNRFAERHKPHLRDCGLSIYSAFGPAPRDTDTLIYRNTHVDIMRWRPVRQFAGEEATLGALAAEIAQRRRGRAEPLGLLTHHLVHDEAAWAFLEKLFERLERSAALRWTQAVKLNG